VKTIHARTYRALLEHLKAARRAAGLTQETVANRLGCPQSFVSKYENGERRLDVLEYLRVTQAIGLDPCKPLRETAELLEPLPQAGHRRNRWRG